MNQRELKSTVASYALTGAVVAIELHFDADGYDVELLSSDAPLERELRLQRRDTDELPRHFRIRVSEVYRDFR